jgi:hypothetical protein
MFYIPIVAGSTRRERQSIKVARFVLKKTQARQGVQTELLDPFPEAIADRKAKDAMEP